MKPALSVLFLIPVLATAQPVLEPSALAGMVGQWSSIGLRTCGIVAMVLGLGIMIFQFFTESDTVPVP